IDWPNFDGFGLDDTAVVVTPRNVMSSTGWSSMPLGATPLCPWMKAKKPTPVTWTGSETCWNEVVGDSFAPNVARAAAIGAVNGLWSLAQSGITNSEISVSVLSASTTW